ncbi:phage capsid protein [Salmonella enterica subsp. enterica serovar Typhimurium]|uniref:GPO family capsid scaffolding protein n=1 Tax=Salmonella enterica TaxID=28901 RepID=UPI0009AC6130|nr:GPO family capsid scaffolding protein [Salmonella enterica]EBN0076173.1 phage capsid protein [Salmonella enterica subsp. enterica serovar Typhimurium]ECN3907428.1 phage capsid protein [Salmonella enterica subsp. enterica serovar Typhimurium]EDT3082370.1 phage capsid protein [Salmonella enterica subsp. enterica serovar Typhimurium]EED7913433.1 phage capsid protein [Salmonella enterica subsp. enterica serovar Typhimurium]MLC04346.1 phage capsid protein [Salmonella enterica subsp. enterica ser
MSHLKTDWLCVATEGDTVDGRIIKRQWIIDMGETYDYNHYVALIWPEHEDDYGNFGEVLEATWNDGEDGLARLYVSLCPNIRLIFANHEDQLLFFSIEPEENWRGSGRTYLKGLAVTDTPASVGTTRLRFSSRRKKLSKQGYYGCVISRDGKIIQEERMKNWQKMFGIKPKFEDETPPDDTTQGDDKLQALANAVNELEGRVAKIENQLNDVQGDVDTIAEVVDTEEFAAIRDNAKDIVKRFNDLGNKSVCTPGRKISEKAGKFNFL